MQGAVPAVPAVPAVSAAGNENYDYDYIYNWVNVILQNKVGAE